MKKKSSLFASLIGSCVGMLTSVQQVSAELTNPVVSGSLGKGSKAAASGSTFTQYFVFFWNAMISIGAIAVLIYFIWGAIEWISSGGDKGKVENARNRITQAVIGLVVLVGSYVIIGFVGKIFFGDTFNVLQITVPQPV